MLGPSLMALYKFGGDIAINIRGRLNTEWWRLITAGFLHAGVVHLFINVVSLLVLAPKIDRWFGNKNILVYSYF